MKKHYANDCFDAKIVQHILCPKILSLLNMILIKILKKTAAKTTNIV
mgnify:CR=1 FL=1